MQRILISLMLACSFSSYAQEATVSLPQVQMFQPKRILRDFNFFLNAIPAPLLGGGAGGAIEFKRFNPLTLWFGLEREMVSTNPFALFEEETQTTSDNRFVGARLYSKKDGSGFYGGTGYKWAEIETVRTPGLLSGVSAREEEDVYGMYGQLGWRYQNIDPRVSWIIELGASYEPGKLKRATYVPHNNGLFGPTEAHVDTDYAYGVFAEARFGVNF